MGLRERNAARTRATIIDTALSLFLARGYDATRMEAIAEAAGVGTSTLYRYFPTKDLLIIGPLAFSGRLADGLRSRPTEEPLAVALGQVLTDLFVERRDDVEQLRQIKAVVDSNHVPRMRLLEEFVNERRLLETAIAERLGRPAPDVFCAMTARLTISVLEYIGDMTLHLPHSPDRDKMLEIFGSLTQQLTAEAPVFPVFTGAT